MARNKDELATSTQALVKRSPPLLPPGLYNLGNSCFFNSVFQSLLATRAIEALVRDAVNHPRAALSPALTNGRPAGTPHDKRLPISDTFLRMVEAAWAAQDRGSRQSMSLRDLLMRLGQKYDQYLDFRQQDAHELLRHLLDAISTEETDIIRERNPRPKKRRKQVQPPTDAAAQPASFIDLVFGGTLASILVCSECHHVSVTREPFNDLSLSLHADASRDRKRDKFSSFASKVQNIQVFRKPSARKRPVSQPPPPKSSPSVQPAYIPTPGLPGGAEPSSSSSSISGGIGRFFRWTKSPEQQTSPAQTQTQVQVQSPSPSPSPAPAPATAQSSRPATPHTLSARTSTEFTPPKLLKRNTSLSLSRPSSRPSSRSSSPKHAPVATAATDESAKTPTKGSRSRSVSPAAGRSPLPRSPLKALLALADDDSSATPKKTTFAPRSRSRKSAKKAYLKALLADTSKSSDASDGETLVDALRAFTAVERMDGDNMIGCRTCWKKKHGQYNSDESSESSSSEEEEESDSDSSAVGSSSSSSSASGSGGPPKSPSGLQRRPSLPPRNSSIHHRLNPSVTSLPSLPLSGLPGRTSEDGAAEDLLDVDADPMASSVASLPERRPSMFLRSASAVDIPPTDAGSDNPYRGPIPSIQTTAPEADAESSDRPSKHRRESARGGRDPSSAGQSKQSSRSPTPDAAEVPAPDAIAVTITDESSSEASASVPSAKLPSPASSVASLESRAPSTSSRAPKPSIRPKVSSKERAKQVIRRPTMKRYLLADAPPVLVLHLKRFQQVSSTPNKLKSNLKLFTGVGVGGGNAAFDGWNRAFGSIGSTLGGFRKVDEWIEFPEELDVGPFVMPRKEDFEEKRRGEKVGREGEFVYRLYAVVVHIGNMLGGHYIAYTALPSERRRPAEEVVEEKAAASPASPVVSRTTTVDETTSISSVSTDTTSTETSSVSESVASSATTASAAPSATTTSPTASMTSASTTPTVVPPTVEPATPKPSNEKAPEKDSERRQWCYISDQTVRLCSFEEVMRAKAYICFYERVAR